MCLFVAANDCKQQILSCKRNIVRYHAGQRGIVVTCCFFGHKDAPLSIYGKLEEAVEKLIIKDSVSSFLVGNQGHFDGMALDVLRKLHIKYPHINYNVVLAYMPGEKEEWKPYDFSETVLPEGIEGVHPRYAISWRNKWMVNESDFVICYVIHSWGGAAKYKEFAKNRKKAIIDIA